MKITGLKRTYEDIEVSLYTLFEVLGKELNEQMKICNESFLREKDGKTYWCVDDRGTEYQRIATPEEIEVFKAFQTLHYFMSTKENQKK